MSTAAQRHWVEIGFRSSWSRTSGPGTCPRTPNGFHTIVA